MLLTCIENAEASRSQRPHRRDVGDISIIFVEIVIERLTIVIITDGHRLAAGRQQAQVGDVISPIGSGADGGEGSSANVIRGSKALQ